jgi:hypothetical protein
LNSTCTSARARAHADHDPPSASYGQTPPGAYRKLLARTWRRRAPRRGLSDAWRADTSSRTPPSPAYTRFGQAFNLAKAPLDLVRGGASPTCVKNAATTASEALEIAVYDAVEALAEAVRRRRDRDPRPVAPRRGDGCWTTCARSSPPSPRRPRTAQVPIADYETLNAGQITARLAELSQRTSGASWTRTPQPQTAARSSERAEQLTGSTALAGYDRDDTPAILARLDADTAPSVRDYETRHRRRVAVLEAAHTGAHNT